MSIQSQTQPISFEEFLEWYPETGKRYELHRGTIVEMQPTGAHELIGGFLTEELILEIRRQKLPYTIPKNVLLKPHLPDSGYFPDVLVLNKTRLPEEPLWKKSSTLQNGQTIPLVVEVVSTNWRDDYGHKFVEYEAMGIGEYWIVDYLALGAVRHIGKPKQPTITICQLVDGEYEMQRFLAGEVLKSRVFPELELHVDDVFQVGQVKE